MPEPKVTGLVAFSLVVMLRLIDFFDDTNNPKTVTTPRYYGNHDWSRYNPQQHERL